MLKIGEFQKLKVIREQNNGFYLSDHEGNEVLLPKREIHSDIKIGDEIKVFIYLDSEDLEVATCESPLITLNKFAYLLVKDVNRYGAFCDWGLPKDLIIPFRNQRMRLRPGQKCIVHMYLDEVTNRLVGTTKLHPFLKHQADANIRVGQEVDLLVTKKVDLGYKVIIDQEYSGLIYRNEVNFPIHPGQQFKGFVKPQRPDKKIDVSIHPIGHRNIEPNAQKILHMLERNKGFLPYSDKSDPEEIRRVFGISKKLFKKSLGALYKQRLVLLKPDGIYKN